MEKDLSIKGATEFTSATLDTRSSSLVVEPVVKDVATSGEVVKVVPEELAELINNYRGNDRLAVEVYDYYQGMRNMARGNEEELRKKNDIIVLMKGNKGRGFIGHPNCGELS